MSANFSTINLRNNFIVYTYLQHECWCSHRQSIRKVRFSHNLFNQANRDHVFRMQKLEVYSEKKSFISQPALSSRFGRCRHLKKLRVLQYVCTRGCFRICGFKLKSVISSQGFNQGVKTLCVYWVPIGLTLMSQLILENTAPMQHCIFHYRRRYPQLFNNCMFCPTEAGEIQINFKFLRS